MKITIQFAGSTSLFDKGISFNGGISLNTGVNHSANVYLNGEPVGWSGWSGKMKLKHVLEGENLIEIEGTDNRAGRRKIRFTANQDVKIWVRETWGTLEILMKGEDVRILENVAIEQSFLGGTQVTEGEPVDGNPKREPEESLWESFKKYI